MADSQLVDQSATPDRIILHVDMDCFYAACERLKDPELIGEPVVVGMGYEADDPHGAVATASYEARKYGINSAMPIKHALERLARKQDADPDDPDAPDPETAAFYRPVDMAFYKEIGQQVRDILAAAADVVEPVSIDEAYLDVTDQTSWDTAAEYAERLRQQINDEVGVTASVGVAPTKSAAKVASDHDKPDGLCVIRPGTVRDFFAPLDIEEVHGIGPKTGDTLRAEGIETAGDLAAADPDRLEQLLGSRGPALRRRARGDDPRPVTPPDDPKSMSSESSINPPARDMDQKEATVRELAADVAERVNKKNALFRTIGIKAVEPPFEVHTRAHTLSGPINDPRILTETALDLLAEFRTTTIRKLGVRVSNLSFGGGQADLGNWYDVSGDRISNPGSKSAKTVESGLQSKIRHFRKQ